MASYQIPEEYLVGFEIILKLKPEELKTVGEEMKQLSVGAAPAVLRDRLAIKMSGEVSDGLALTLYSFGELLVLSNKSIESLSEEIANSYNHNRDKSLNAKELNTLKNNLIYIFDNCNNLKITFKTYSLIRDNNNIYKEARVISDIRLVFNDDIYTKERNGIIIHQLKLEYYNEDNEKEFYVSLDTNDLKKLRDQIERAIEKEKTIIENYKEITFLNLE